MYSNAQQKARHSRFLRAMGKGANRLFDEWYAAVLCDRSEFCADTPDGQRPKLTCHLACDKRSAEPQ